jgi:citronellol/citronellal dehydrogenase
MISTNGFDAVIRNNLHGTFLMMREAYNQWMQHHGGSIVNMTADMWGGMPGMGHSGAARAGVDNLTKTAIRGMGQVWRAGQCGGAGLDHVVRHGYLSQGDFAKFVIPLAGQQCAAQAHGHRIGSLQRHLLSCCRKGGLYPA